MANIMLELTRRGREYVEEMMEGEGKRLIITRIVTSSAQSPTPTELTAINPIVQQIDPRNFRADGPRGIIDAELTNECNCHTFNPTRTCVVCTTGYEIRQIGIFALNDPSRPQGGDFLFRIAQFQNPTRVPPRRDRHWTFKPSFVFAVDNAANVEVRLDPRTHRIHKHRTILTDEVGVHGMRVNEDEDILEYRETNGQANVWRKFVLRNDGYIHLSN
ncbi:MAG: hypothetical protein FWE40_04825 [Oscillospiraceae bacterium]|nr:hypothetical protein [Oscillospiraceae bacterium]